MDSLKFVRLCREATTKIDLQSGNDGANTPARQKVINEFTKLVQACTNPTLPSYQRMVEAAVKANMITAPTTHHQINTGPTLTCTLYS